jgi:hypothetical protein
MKTRNQSRLAEDTPATAKKEDAVTLLSILPFVLSVEEGKLFPLADKRNLRVTCRAAKAMVDPYLEKINLLNPYAIVPNSDQLNTFLRSSLVNAARHIRCSNGSHYISSDYLHKLSCIPFKNLQKAELSINSHALSLLPAGQWSKLTNLNLIVRWHYNLHSSDQFINLWKTFSKANWPLLETLIVSIEAERHYTDISEEESDEVDGFPDFDFGELVACLLSYFPNLKELRIQNLISLEDAKAFTAVPHNNLERINISFHEDPEIHMESPAVGALAALSEAKWPKLQDLTVDELGRVSIHDIHALLKAPWIINLNKIVLSGCSLTLEAARELFNGLQFGALETLAIYNLCATAFAVFQDDNIVFPKLKYLVLGVEGRSVNENTRLDFFDIGLSRLFSSGKLPCVETLIISDRAIYQASGRAWTMAPAGGANEMREGNHLSVLPSLKVLKLSGLHIAPTCSKFLGSLYTRGRCEINVGHCEVDSGLDSLELTRMLEKFNITRPSFDQELLNLNLYEEVFWYNLLSMDELKNVAASMFFSTIAATLNETPEPARASMEQASMAMKKGPEEKTRQNVLLLTSYRDALKSLSKLNSVVLEGQGFGASGVSGSGGGGGGGRVTGGQQ